MNDEFKLPDAIERDTMCVLGADGQKYHLFKTRTEEDAAVRRSPLKVAMDLIELGQRVGPSLPNHK